MAKRKANASEELRVLKARIAELELECMEQTNVSEAFEQSRNEVDDDGVQIVEIQGQIEADPQQKKFRENISKMKEELSNTEQLCMITQLENKLLHSKLKHHELMEEQNELQAKVAKMVDHQQQQKNKQGRKEDEQAEQLKAISGRLDDLEKQQQQMAGNENAMAKIERLENFNAILKDRFRIDLLKAVHPNFRQNFVENFSNSLPKNYWDANACDNKLRIIDDKCLTVSWCSEKKDTSDLFLSPCSVGPWFPCISLSDDTKIVANFGPDFKFDPTKIVSPSISPQINFWDADACDNGLKITDNEKLTVHYNEEKTHWLTVFAKDSILVPNYADFFYFEIKVKNMNKGVLFGFTTKKIHGDGDMYGNAWYSDGIFGYLSDGHLWTSGSGVPCSKFAAGSVVGCGINLNNRQLIFTRNGHRLDDDDYRVSSSVGPLLFPFVTLFAVGEKIGVNFGPKFEFNFENI